MSTMLTQRRVGRRGFTLVELMISLSIFGIIIAGAMSFMAQQNSAFQKGSDRMTALTNLQYTLQILETDLSTLGTNLVPGQPGMVYADDDLIAFNSDYATNASGDPWAVYYDPDAPTGEVTSPQTALTIPGTAFTWPDTAYQTAAMTPAPAELIIFQFTLDTATTRSDDYTLRRKVNNQPWQTVARNLLKSGNEPFFRYLTVRDEPGKPTRLDSIPAANLPQNSDGYWADSIRAVRTTVRATNGLSGDDEHTADLTRIVTMPNAGLLRLSTCGDEPILGSGLLAVAGTDASGDPIVTLTWGSAVDDGGGENDVMRYVIWRKVAGLVFQDPLVSVPPGNGNTYVDSEVEAGTTYQYQLAAQDCTPALSGTASSVNVTP